MELHEEGPRICGAPKNQNEKDFPAIMYHAYMIYLVVNIQIACNRGGLINHPREHDIMLIYFQLTPLF